MFKYIIPEYLSDIKNIIINYLSRYHRHIVFKKLDKFYRFYNIFIGEYDEKYLNIRSSYDYYKLNKSILTKAIHYKDVDIFKYVISKL